MTKCPSLNKAGASCRAQDTASGPGRWHWPFLPGGWLCSGPDHTPHSWEAGHPDLGGSGCPSDQKVWLVKSLSDGVRSGKEPTALAWPRLLNVKVPPQPAQGPSVPGESESSQGHTVLPESHSPSNCLSPTPPHRKGSHLHGPSALLAAAGPGGGVSESWLEPQDTHLRVDGTFPVLTPGLHLRRTRRNPQGTDFNRKFWEMSLFLRRCCFALSPRNQPHDVPGHRGPRTNPVLRHSL